MPLAGFGNGIALSAVVEERDATVQAVAKNRCWREVTYIYSIS
jgi:hypothetical protein